MSLQFILGSPGTGKTTYCLNEINSQLDNEMPLYYIVPEQFSLQSEKLLLDYRRATTRVQVLSFNRLAFRLFSELGSPPGKLADDLGKQMLLRKVLFDVELSYYKSAVDKHGFVDSLARTITELNQYRVSTTDLRVRATDSPPAMEAKLNDLAIILEKYRETVTGRYLLTDDMQELLYQKLVELQNEPIPLLDGGYFWVDGFVGFTPQERQILLQLMKRATSMKITLTTRDVKGKTDPLCLAPRETMQKILDKAFTNNIFFEPPLYLEKNHRHVNAEGLSYFVQNFSIYSIDIPLPPENDNIKVIAATDRYSAVYSAAEHILEWVNSNKCQFRDIAILCGDRSHYEKILQTAFDRVGIPLFVDTEIDMLSHPLTEMIRATLEIIVRNWSYESVFRFLKTHLTGIEICTVDILENYVLEHGISSFKWLYPFKDPLAEEGRLQLFSALEIITKSRGSSRADSKDTIYNHSKRIFDMLYILKVPETLQKWYDHHMTIGDPATARIHKQIWPALCEVFDKLVEILGDEKVTVKTFAATLEAGLTQVGLGCIPPTVDQVILGDLGRSRYPKIKMMIVLGANEGILPPRLPQTSLFTEYERTTLMNSGLELAPENLFRVTEGFYNLYCAVSQPSDKLVFIYSQGDSKGKHLRPSLIVNRVLEMFPKLKVEQASRVMEYGKKDWTPLIEPLSKTSIDKLYGKIIITAASRLESFASCPFAYFMTYLLKARERKHFDVLFSDLGSLFHDILAQFSKRTWINGNIPDFSRTEISQIVNELVGQITIDSAIFNSSARNRHILDKVRNVATASIWALSEHLKQGKFEPSFTEHEIFLNPGINLEDGRQLRLTGQVDRIDLFHSSDGNDYIKVIDYKSGQTKFNIDEVKQGTQLQLMLYMNTLLKTLETGKSPLPGGVFYFPIDDPIINADDLLDDPVREANILKCFRMSGLTVENALTGMDTSLGAGTSSSIIPVSLNKNGTFNKTSQSAILDLDEFSQLGDEVNDIIKGIGDRMIQGDIIASPCIVGKRNPCQYCNYSALCGRKY